jgi:hypothetical protein
MTSARNNRAQRLPAPPPEPIEHRIYLVRGQKVVLDADLAGLYQIRTSDLNKAVKRNPERFPADFMFQMTTGEAEALRFQMGTSNDAGRGGRRYLPYAFTEQGVAMLSSVLRSPRAIEVNIAIMRAFVRLRQILSTHQELAERLGQLEKQQDEHASHISMIWEAIQEMIDAPVPEKRRIGFPAQE